MKFFDFIERVQNLDDSVLQDLEVKKYVTLQEKLNAIYMLILNINQKCGDNMQTLSYTEVFEVERFFALLKIYTNLEISSDDITTDNYDLCQSIGVERIINNQGSPFEMRKFNSLVDKMTAINDTIVLRQILLNQDFSQLKESSDTMISELEQNGDTVQRLIQLFTPLSKK